MYALRCVPFLLCSMFLANLCACSDPDVDHPDIAPTIEFPQADENGVLPLNAEDGFPFQVKVSTPLSAHLIGALKAQVTLLGGAGSDEAVTDVTTPLASDGPNRYAATVTLNAPGPGPVIVQAEIAGSLTSPVMKTIQLPVMAGSVAATSQWSGDTPRYAICVDSSAVKGRIDLTAADTSILGDETSLSAMLQPNPCSANNASGSIHSHANFVVAALPPFAVSATLHGRPAGIAASDWTTEITAGADMVPAVNLVLASAPVQATADGTLFALTATAMTNETPVQGLHVLFSLLSSTADTPPSLQPPSGTTDQRGAATTYLVVSTGKQAVVEVSAANAIRTIVIQG